MSDLLRSELSGGRNKKRTEPVKNRIVRIAFLFYGVKVFLRHDRHSRLDPVDADLVQLSCNLDLLVFPQDA